MKPRVLVLTAGYGEGHNAAARAFVAACDEAHGAGTAKLADVFEIAAPRFSRISRRAYLDLINALPHAWSTVYGWADRSPLVPKLFALLVRERRVLRALLERERPAVICSTYPVYAYLLEAIARAGGPVVPHFNIVTDSISINSLWWRAPCGGWFVPNADSADVMRRGGVDPARLHVSGFPVARFFTAHAAEFAPPDLAAGAAPRVLYIINSGTRGAAETARRLLAENEWEVTCAVGRDETLRRELTALTQGRAHRAEILGWTDQIPKLLMTHHVVVSKAGGATTQEAIAARCPMIVNQIVPGQEEGNYELLRRHGAGALAETPERVIATLRRVFADQGREWQAWRTAITALTQPDAGGAIVKKVFALTPGLGEPLTVPPLTAANAIAGSAVAGAVI